jgi:hypothetical protein
MIAVLIPQLIEANLFDELHLWDTNERDKPTLILSQRNGRLVVENEDLFDPFKAKVNER